MLETVNPVRIAVGVSEGGYEASPA